MNKSELMSLLEEIEREKRKKLFKAKEKKYCSW